jgi:hypothetical protein
MNKSVNVHRNSASFTRHNAGGLSLIAGFMPVTTEMALFDYPFNELLVRMTYLIYCYDALLITDFTIIIISLLISPLLGHRLSLCIKH